MKKRTISLSIVTGLALVFIITIIASGCGKKTPSTTAPDETASTAPESTTAEPSSQPLSSSESEVLTSEPNTEEVTETEPETAPETTSSSLPADDPTGWTGGEEMTVSLDEGIELTTIRDSEGNNLELAGIRNYRWIDQPHDSTHWTIVPKDMELLPARCDARTLVMQGYALNSKVHYLLAFRMLEPNEDPKDYQYYPVNMYYTYQHLGYTIDYFNCQHQWPQSEESFGSFEDIVGFTTKFSGDVLYCVNEETGRVIVDQAYISYNPGAAYRVMGMVKIETTKELYDRLSTGKLEIDDDGSMLYALFEGAAVKYPDVTYPLARYLTVDVFDDGTWIYWD